ncbi:TetR/AcrR family transcriptional regulator [Pseudohongiella sp. O18]|uniref:TetR/AcrR family transcriptional regulator n=1 Tax=Pseudohongiella sp. O18 TaxID=2904248 RepID=UPI001EFFEAFC|nr:TetR/AcrR family transcriptional regulator [Pseudohongiella sp. O18]
MPTEPQSTAPFAAAELSSSSRREANARATRDAMIRAGRAAFSQYGFAEAPLDVIVQEAQVTTGALYHHFGNKKGLFQAVAESIEQEILDRISAALSDDMSGWEQLETAMHMTFALCADAGVHRILFSDAPNVIGMREWRSIELRYGFGLVRGILGKLKDEGQLCCNSTDLTAQMLLGAVMEAVHAVVMSEDSERTAAEAKETLLGFMQTLRTTPAT